MLELPILLFLTRLSKLELFLHKFTVRLNDFANTHCAQKKEKYLLDKACVHKVIHAFNKFYNNVLARWE